MRKNLLFSLAFAIVPFLGLLFVELKQGNYLEKSGELKFISYPIPPVLSPKPLTNISDEQIYKTAEAITVRVFSGENKGSGILIHRQNNLYTIVTNHHVLIFGEQEQSYKVETPDGEIYSAKVIKNVNFKPYDLGLLQFQSQKNYQVTSLSSLANPVIGEEVYAVGFPFEETLSPSRGFLFTKGNLQQISDLSFEGGYKIGSTNDIKKGMSGGPLLNRQGQVIAINGRHKNPLWGNPYTFEDGTIASSEQKEQMNQLSWAIPIQTFLQLAPQFSRKNQDSI